MAKYTVIIADNKTEEVIGTVGMDEVPLVGDTMTFKENSLMEIRRRRFEYDVAENHTLKLDRIVLMCSKASP